MAARIFSYKIRGKLKNKYEGGLNRSSFFIEEVTMNYAEIKKRDISNGPGVRVSVFVSGCNLHCNGCFNDIAWNFNYGKTFTNDTIDEIIEALRPDYISGLTVLGGEPFEFVNQKGILPLLKRVREEFPEKSIWCYSGYYFDKEIIDEMSRKWPVTKEMLSYIDVLVDSRFDIDYLDLNLRFKGSSNQRIIDVQKSLKEGSIVLWKDEGVFYNGDQERC